MPTPITSTWVTPGKILEVDVNGKVLSGPNPVDVGTIDVVETGNSFYFKDYPDAAPAGIPVNANLGIFLIKMLFDKIADIQQHPGDDPSIHVEWLINLLLKSKAITFDKNALQKTLSQPGCEGIRFYHCLKPVVETGSGDVSDVLSFVTVGVDKDGVDLGYTYNSEVAQDIKENSKYKVVNQSLLSEFSYPPPAGYSPTEAETIYIIGGYAWPV